MLHRWAADVAIIPPTELCAHANSIISYPHEWTAAGAGEISGHKFHVWRTLTRYTNEPKGFHKHDHYSTSAAVMSAAGICRAVPAT